jgi:hypothetical protein
MPVECHKVSTKDRAAILCLPVSCSRDHYVMAWRLDRTGFVPGEKIRINGEIHNNGKTKIRKSKALLLQVLNTLNKIRTYMEFVYDWMDKIRATPD